MKTLCGIVSLQLTVDAVFMPIFFRKFRKQNKMIRTLFTIHDQSFRALRVWNPRQNSQLICDPLYFWKPRIRLKCQEKNRDPARFKAKSIDRRTYSARS